MEFITDYYWEIFIVIEVLSLISLILFGLFRYVLDRHQTSRLFIILFITLLLSEAGLGLYINHLTGEISIFVIIVIIFLIYAATFGIVDFLKLDRWMRSKVGDLRGVDLLTEQDKLVIKRNQDPKYIAKKYRITSLIHLVVFLIGQTILWSLGTGNTGEMLSYLTDLSWLNDKDYLNSPYPSEMTYGIGKIWGIAFIADFLYSWSYTLFPRK